MRATRREEAPATAEAAAEAPHGAGAGEGGDDEAAEGKAASHMSLSSATAPLSSTTARCPCSPFPRALIPGAGVGL